ncbi:MAG: high-affinity iron transporter, partial [Spirochaetes bacterium]|nr:high-affinity iron transporter [Spirochaetota bacterium]
ALIIGIIFSYLKKAGIKKARPYIYLGIAAGIAGSIIGAWAFESIAGSFSGLYEQIFEGITMLIGALLLTSLILWIMSKGIRNIKRKIALETSKKNYYGLFFLVFISILREGIESVIFLNAASYVYSRGNLTGAVAGFVTAMVLGYLIFIGFLKLDLKKFFSWVNIIFILFAAGLIANAVHELQEAGWIPVLIEHVWDINPPVISQGIFPLFHDKGYVGSMAAGLLGYNGNPSLIEVTAYILYLAGAVSLWLVIKKKKVNEKTL